MSSHIGRSFTGHQIEDACPCAQMACGLVDEANIDTACTHHPLGTAKTIRQCHEAADCPGAEIIHRVTVTSQYAKDGTELEPRVEFTCESPAAKCHEYPACDCEYWSGDHAEDYGDGHEMKRHEECWLVGWFDNDGFGTFYTGPDSNDMHDAGLPRGMNRTGLITASFCDDSVEWEFKA